MGGSPETLGLLAVAGPQTYSGTLGQPADFSYCQSPHSFPEVQFCFPAVLGAASGKPGLCATYHELGATWQKQAC